MGSVVSNGAGMKIANQRTAATLDGALAAALDSDLDALVAALSDLSQTTTVMQPVSIAALAASSAENSPAVKSIQTVESGALSGTATAGTAEIAAEAAIAAQISSLAEAGATQGAESAGTTPSPVFGGLEHVFDVFYGKETPTANGAAPPFVAEFKDGVDRLDFRVTSADEFSDLTIDRTLSGIGWLGVRIEADASDRVLWVHVGPAGTLDASDFIF